MAKHHSQVRNWRGWLDLEIKMGVLLAISEVEMERVDPGAI